MADGSGYDLPRDAQSMISIELAIEMIEGGDACTGFCVDLGGDFRLESADPSKASELLQRLRGHMEILFLSENSRDCETRANPGADPILHPKVADILDALD